MSSCINHSPLLPVKKAPSTLRRGNLKTAFSFSKRIKCFLFTLRLRSLQTQQLLDILNLCLKKTLSGKLHDYRAVIGFEKLRFQNVFHPQENENLVFPDSPSLKSVLEKPCFRDELMWTLGLTIGIKLRFQISLE